MNITQRINARKMVLSYVYEHCFFSHLKKSDKSLQDILFIDNVFPTDGEKYEDAKKEFISLIDTYLHMNIDEVVEYYLEYFFDKWKREDIDIDYVMKVIKGVHTYKDEIVEKVDIYTSTFRYYQMDLIDQTLFLLGYVEWKVLETPKEILLNELVELGKRYADEGSTKLINGIMHKIFTEKK